MVTKIAGTMTGSTSLSLQLRYLAAHREGTHSEGPVKVHASAMRGAGNSKCLVSSTVWTRDEKTHPSN